MSPAWALAGRGGTPQPLQPPSLGLIDWNKGDAGLQGTAGLATAWLDQSGFGQDLDQFDVGFQPSVGVSGDVVDGIPALSFPISGLSEKYLFRATDLLDRDGNPIQVGPIDVFIVCKPKFSVANFNITGGPAFTVFNQVQPSFTCLFDLEDTSIPNGAYGWSRAWRDLSSALQFTPEPGGAGGAFNNVPTLLEWRSSGFPTIELLINNAVRALTPSTMYGTSGPQVQAGFMCGNVAFGGAGLNFQGSINEILIYDRNLASDATAHTAVVDYLRSRFPSLPA